jgi:hypothetical protein
VKATLLYTLARVGVFAALFGLLRLTPLSVYLAAAFAAVLALLISYLFFGRLRSGVAESIARRRAAPERDDDADEEDAIIDDGDVARAQRSPAAARRSVAPAEDD